jgi:hypothetical protein
MSRKNVEIEFVVEGGEYDLYEATTPEGQTHEVAVVVGGAPDDVTATRRDDLPDWIAEAVEQHVVAGRVER